MNETFYCGGCGRHKPIALLSRTTKSGRKVCKSCDAEREAREAKRKSSSKYYKSNQNATGLDDEKHERKRTQKKYLNGKLPGFMSS